MEGSSYALSFLTSLLPLFDSLSHPHLIPFSLVTSEPSCSLHGDLRDGLKLFRGAHIRYIYISMWNEFALNFNFQAACVDEYEKY